MRGEITAGKKVAISQSNYIPWRGYFALIASVDEFVLYDEAQYTRRDWRNRNRIPTPAGLKWLTIPVAVKGRYSQTIRETRVSDPGWAERHWETIRHIYRKAPYFSEISALLEPLYSDSDECLSNINEKFIRSICGYLRVGTKISQSCEYEISGDRSEKLANICHQAGGAIYVSAPAAKAYLDPEPFDRRRMSVAWFDYEGFKEYPQLNGGFEPAVSIIDLLFNCGPDARAFLERAV